VWILDGRKIDFRLVHEGEGLQGRIPNDKDAAREPEVRKKHPSATKLMPGHANHRPEKQHVCARAVSGLPLRPRKWRANATSASAAPTRVGAACGLRWVVLRCGAGAQTLRPKRSGLNAPASTAVALFSSRSASRRALPQAMPHPLWPCPMLRNTPGACVAPIKGSPSRGEQARACPRLNALAHVGRCGKMRAQGVVQRSKTSFVAGRCGAPQRCTAGDADAVADAHHRHLRCRIDQRTAWPIEWLTQVQAQ